MPNDATPLLIILAALAFGATVLGLMRWLRPAGPRRRR